MRSGTRNQWSSRSSGNAVHRRHITQWIFCPSVVKCCSNEHPNMRQSNEPLKICEFFKPVFFLEMEIWDLTGSCSEKFNDSICVYDCVVRSGWMNGCRGCRVFTTIWLKSSSKQASFGSPNWLLSTGITISHSSFYSHIFRTQKLGCVHIDTSSVRSVRVTCEFHSCEQFLCRSCFYPCLLYTSPSPRD